jgi:hypothetical protein
MSKMQENKKKTNSFQTNYSHQGSKTFKLMFFVRFFSCNCKCLFCRGNNHNHLLKRLNRKKMFLIVWRKTSSSRKTVKNSVGRLSSLLILTKRKMFLILIIKRFILLICWIMYVTIW